jgi:hypothetical protein
VPHALPTTLSFILYAQLYLVWVQIMKLPFCNFLHSPITSSLLGLNILVITLSSYTVSLYSSLNMRDHVSHLYKTTGTIKVLCVLTSALLDSRLKAKDSEPKGSKQCPNLFCCLRASTFHLLVLFLVICTSRLLQRTCLLSLCYALSYLLITSV